MSHSEEPPVPANEPPAEPPPPPADPPPVPPADPPSPPSGTDGERLERLETLTGNLVESVTGLLDAIAPKDPDDAPQKKPWTHWGSK
jgi:hypothetical protein